ncbi:MAG TPA: class I SAM-dependent methyltransferase [Kosmotogaceae bacterium]|nr:class I SAM-dependent methyltransferase [Kosmotogaceae bacterium]
MKNEWNWELADKDLWSQPSPEAYYLLARWGGNGAKILDLGCGIGRHSLLFAASGYEVSAIDSSAEALKSLKEKAMKEKLLIDARRALITGLPYEDEYFDYAVAFYVIYHGYRRDVQKALSEMKRVLKPGGECYVTFNSSDSSSFRRTAGRRIDRRTIVKSEGIEDRVPHYYVNATELRKLLKGFEIISLRKIREYFDKRTSSHFFVLLKKPEN